MPIKPRSSGVSGGYSDTLPQTLMNNRLRRGGQDAAILGLTFWRQGVTLSIGLTFRQPVLGLCLKLPGLALLTEK